MCSQSATLRCFGATIVLLTGVYLIIFVAHDFGGKAKYHEPIMSVTIVPVPSQSGRVNQTDSIFNFTLTPSVSISTTRLLLLVISSPTEFKRRQWIRGAWGAKKRLEKYRASLVFVVGNHKDRNVTQKLKEESEQFRDLLHDNYLEEAYANLTRKVLGALYWTSIQPWRKLRFVAKVDSDVFLNVKSLTLVYEKAPVGLPCIMGQSLTRGLVIRAPEHRWYVNKTVYPHKYFPYYANGPSYLISKEAISKLICLKTLLDLRERRELSIEDVYITGMLRKRYGIELINVDWFFFILPASPSTAELQRRANQYICLHTLKEEDMKKFKAIPF